MELKSESCIKISEVIVLSDFFILNFEVTNSGSIHIQKLKIGKNEGLNVWVWSTWILLDRIRNIN